MRAPRWRAFGRAFGRADEGATVAEYALLVALVALVVFAAVTVLGTTTSDKLADQRLHNALQ